MDNKIYPCLWFNGEAKEAATFYCAVFDNSAITADSPMVVNFSLAGQKFMGLNGGPEFRINPSVSFFVVCESTEETDSVWQKLLEGGTVLMPIDKYDWSDRYGWLQDRFGVSWQISQGKVSDVGQKFTPALMFTGEQHGKAEAAIRHYTSVFQPSSIDGILRWEAAEGEPAGTVKHAQFRILDYVMMVMENSGQHQFGFNEAVSIVVSCENQEEIDHYWKELSEGGLESRCGWLKDLFGVSWQIVPRRMHEMMSEATPEQMARLTQAFLPMKKFDLAALEKAYAG